MAKFDSNRIQPGTISFTRDATTGEFKIQQQGFLKLPDLSLPTIDQADYDTGDGTTPPPNSDTPTPEKTLPFIPGGDDKSQPMMDVRDVKKFQPMDEGQVADASKQFSETDIAYKNYEDTLDSYSKAVNANRNLLATGGASPKIMSDFQARENQAKTALDKARANVGMSTTGDMKVGAPGDPGFEGPDRGIIEPSKPLVDPITGAGRSQSVKFKERFDPTEIQAADPVKQNMVQKAADFLVNRSTFKVGVQALGTGMETIAKAGVAIGDTLLGVTEVDKRRRAQDSSAARSLGYKTIGELGGSTDPGTIATSSADSVFVGLNRESAKGNLSQAAANRIETRMTVGQARVDKKYGANSKQANDFRQKTKDFQKEANDFNSQKEKEKTAETKSQNPNLRAGAGGEGGSKGDGKIVCTMMNESYGFGSFRNKIWMKFHGNISPEYQKGYHKLFLPLVNYAKQKGITNKIIKNILEHIAVHSTIDMRQSLRGKTHMLGRVYRKIILPLCYWAGRK